MSRARCVVPAATSSCCALPFTDACVALVVNLFTSFGYFRDDLQPSGRPGDRPHQAAGGWFVLDYLHAGQVRDSLVSRDGRTVGTVTVDQEREISPGGRYVRKTIAIGDLGRTFVERVRLFEPTELVGLCELAGFHVDEVLGESSGSALTDDSPRVILFARRL